MERNLKPRFEVQELEGTLPRRVATPKIRLDDDGKPKLNKDGDNILLGGFEYEDIQCPAGWMVYFPSGSSIHVWTKEEMERQGFLGEVPLTDMDTGDTVGPELVMSFKAKADQIANRPRSTRPAQI